MIRCLAMAVSLVLAGLPATAAEEKKTELEGTWELISFERNGKEVNIQKDTRLVVTGDKFSIKVGDKTVAAGTSKLDPSKKPKAVDAMYTEGADKGKSFKGIYELNGDRLKFCRPGSPDDKRPTEFKTTPEGGLMSVYKRAK